MCCATQGKFKENSLHMKKQNLDLEKSSSIK